MSIAWQEFFRGLLGFVPNDAVLAKGLAILGIPVFIGIIVLFVVHEVSRKTKK